MKHLKRLFLNGHKKNNVLSLEHISTIIFDVDGTLYHMLPVKILIVFEMLFYFLVHFRNIWQIKILQDFRSIRKQQNWKSRTLEEQMNFIAQQNKRSSSEVYSIINNWIFKRPSRYLHFFRNRNVLKIFNFCKTIGIKTIIYSDYPPVEKLKILRIYPDYLFYHGDGVIQEMKPSIESMKKITESVKIDTNKVVYIGDSIQTDEKSANLISVRFINVKHIKKELIMNTSRKNIHFTKLS